MNKIRRFLWSDDGPTAVEYAVMLGLILMACLTGITLLGQETYNSYSGSSSKISAAISGGS